MDIATKRKSLGLTQHACARFCGVSLTAFRNWENGTSQPTGERKENLQELLGE